MLVTGDLDEQSNTALHYSVTCAEDVPRISADDAARTLAPLRTKTLAERALSVCAAWPKGVAAADATTPVKSDVPVLILSGGLDPVTPPANGAEVAKSLPASRHIIARGYGHIVSPHACGPRLIAAFIDDPTFDDAARVVRRALREKPAAAAVARSARCPLLIVVENLAKAFGRQREVHAVDGVAFTAPDRRDHRPPRPERRRQDDAPADARDADDSGQRQRAHRAATTSSASVTPFAAGSASCRMRAGSTRV